MTRSVHLLGAGGHAKVVIATLRAAGMDVVAAWDDDLSREGSTVLGVPVEGPILACPPDAEVAVGIGSNRVRARLAADPGRRYVSVVHPAAWVHESVRLGPGTVVFAGAVIQPDATLGRLVIVNTCASIDHECRIGDFAHVAPGVRLGGNVEVGTGALLGIGSVARGGAAVGAWATVGAGSVVIQPVPEGVCVVGCPARPIRKKGPSGR